MKLGFKVGEKLVYPNHGVTIVEQIGESPIMGADDTYYHLRLLANNSRLMVPIRNTDRHAQHHRSHDGRRRRRRYSFARNVISTDTRDVTGWPFSVAGLNRQL